MFHSERRLQYFHLCLRYVGLLPIGFRLIFGLLAALSSRWPLENRPLLRHVLT